MRIDFGSKLTYGNDAKYIKTKIEKYTDSMATNFLKKNTKRKSALQMSIK